MPSRSRSRSPDPEPSTYTPFPDPAVAHIPPPTFPLPASTLHGTYCALRPLSRAHIPGLYKAIGGKQNAWLWKYMLSGPYFRYEEFEHDISIDADAWDWNGGGGDGGEDRGVQRAGAEKVFWTIMLKSATDTSAPNSNADADANANTDVKSKPDETLIPAGVLALHRIQPPHQSLEIGYVVFSPLIQRQPAATESIYLISHFAFEQLGYWRVEWKCNALNLASRRAAKRLGFNEEGTMRGHMVVKGRRRDTSWFAVGRGQWDGEYREEEGEDGEGNKGEEDGKRDKEGRRKGVRQAFELWLSPGNFDEEGKQRRGLKEIREGG